MRMGDRIAPGACNAKSNSASDFGCELSQPEKAKQAKTNTIERMVLG
jgi:hypothetical protein